MNDYRMMHQAPDADGVSAPLHALDDGIYPSDVYTHPEMYGHETPREALAQMHAARGNPGYQATIYRAVPHGVSVIDAGDWVTISLEYARQHAIQDDDPAHDWPVITAKVNAALLFSEGNDLCEFGYQGERLEHCPTA